MPVDRLLQAYHAVRLRNRPRRFTHLTSFAPVLDPDLLPHHPFDPAAAPRTRDIPMLLGWNREDMAFFPGDDMGMFDLSEDDLLSRLKALAGDRASALACAYRAEDPAASPSRIFLRAYSDWSIGGAVLEQAERKAAFGDTPAYVYRFDHPSPAFGGKLGAVHSSETAYVFGQGGPFLDPEASGVGEMMRDTWVQFATSGDPNLPGGELSHWKPFGAEREIMLLRETPRPLANPIPDASTWATP